jgi:glycosyltransferase involved in cell wall biosynthesis
MNIGIDARMYGPRVGGGGLGRYVEQLVNELQVIDTKNRYVLFLKKENFDACVITNPNFEKRLADVHWYTVEEQLKMGRIVDREHLDIVHFPHWNVPLFIRTPFVVTIHDLILLDEPYSSKISTRHQTIFALKYWGYKLVLSHAIARAKKVIAVSHATANSILHHIEGVAEKKIEVVYEGITPLPTSACILPPPPCDYLLYVGNAYPHKNLERLLDAFKKIQTNHPEIKLILAGHESAFYKRLLEHVPTNVELIKNPTDTELGELYCNALLYVYPSRVEGFGLPPLEAMSARVPVAASNIPSLKEILGDAAAYFNPNDSQNMASVLGEIIDSSKKRAQLIEKGTEHIKRYSWKKMALTIQTLYETCGKKGS